MSIQENRRNEAKMKRKRKHYNSAWNVDGNAVVIGMTATTPKRCNCWMCSNQRKHFGDKFCDIKKKSAVKINDISIEVDDV